MPRLQLGSSGYTIIGHINAPDQEKLKERGVGVAYTYREAISLSYVSSEQTHERQSRRKEEAATGTTSRLELVFTDIEGAISPTGPGEKRLPLFYFILTTSVP